MNCNDCTKEKECDDECFFGIVNKKARGFTFKITCNRCGGNNITIGKDTDYSFDGENEYLIDTGDLSVHCKDCNYYLIVSTGEMNTKK